MESHPQIRTTAPHIDFALRIQVNSIGCPDSSDRRGINLSPGGFCARQASSVTPSPSQQDSSQWIKGRSVYSAPQAPSRFNTYTGEVFERK